MPAICCDASLSPLAMEATPTTSPIAPHIPVKRAVDVESHKVDQEKKWSIRATSGMLWVLKPAVGTACGKSLRSAPATLSRIGVEQFDAWPTGTTTCARPEQVPAVPGSAMVSCSCTN